MSSQPQIFGGARDSAGWLGAMMRGAGKRCPRCGEGRLFDGYVRTRSACSACGLDFSGHRADDAPPYMTIMIVGHAAIPLALAAKQLLDPPLWQQFLFWTPALALATYAALPMCKGALIGLQWANRMHGFAEGDGRAKNLAAEPPIAP